MVPASLRFAGCVPPPCSQIVAIATLTYPFAASGAIGLLRLALQPFVVLVLRQNLDVRLHVVMTQAAKLRTHDFVLARLNSREMNGNFEARHEVRLNSQLWDEERMNHVLAVKSQQDRLVDGNR